MGSECNMDLYHLPFDAQRCIYKQGLYYSPASQVRLEWRAGAPALAGWDTTCVDEFYVANLTQEILESEYEGRGVVIERVPDGRFDLSLLVWT